MLVFTAGLLMRAAKLGLYALPSASLLVLHDAFSAVRNHPMNTLLREYHWKMPTEEGVPRPRVSIAACTCGPARGRAPGRSSARRRTAPRHASCSPPARRE